LILLNSFAQLETQQVEQNLQRVVDALESEAHSLSTTAADYASWDDTYAFAEDGNQDYIDSNLSPETFSNLGLHLLLITGPDGAVVYGSGFDLEEGQMLPWPETALNEYLPPTGAVFNLINEDDSRQGLLLLPAGPMLVAVRPILTSEYSGPVRGALLMGRYLDEAGLDRLAELTHLDLRLDPLRAFEAAEPTSVSPAAALQVEVVSAATIVGYATLVDLVGEPIATLRVELPRSVYQQGQSTLSFFMLALAVTGLVFGAVIWLLLERFVLSRLAGLSGRVGQIAAQSDLTLRVPVAGRDELAHLATGINRMLQGLADSRKALRDSEQQFRTLAETSAAAIFITEGGATRYANARAEEVTGFRAEELRAISLGALTRSTPGLPGASPNNASLDADGAAPRNEVEIFTRDGEPRWLELTAGPIEFEGRPATILTAYDITERKRAQQAALVANDKLSGLVGELEQRTRENALLSELSDLLQASPTTDDSYATISQFLGMLFPALESRLYIYRSSRDTLVLAASGGRQPEPGVRRTLAPDECLAIRLGRTHLYSQDLRGASCVHVQRETVSAFICVPLLAQGEALGVLHLQPEPAGGGSGLGLPALTRLGETVAERLSLALANVRLREALRHQAIRDPLTGLFNRRYMQETLDREVSRALRFSHPLSVIFLDLDHFKRFNDTHGHDAGDTLLRELGNLLRRNLRAEDIVCRYGGEEIVIIMPDAALEATRQRAETLRADIHGMTVKHYGQTLGEVTASMGVASLPEHGNNGEALIRAADQALLQAKQAGRDRVLIADGA
jgi:diguanylate cyclase (GGDEF)-like protein/PAS domain S-box-containing protein